jgi:hypothetical protein
VRNRARRRDRHAAQPEDLLYQNPDESNYADPLRGGFYRRITTTAEHQTCAYVVGSALDAVGNNIYSTVTGVFAKSAKKTAESPALADLETNYAVLAYQPARYEKTLRLCEHSHPTTSCLKVFAEHSEHEFALFERRLGSDQFPARAKAQVDALAATARHLTKLFQQLDADPRPGETLGKIAVGVVTFDHEYAALVHKVS